MLKSFKERTRCNNVSEYKQFTFHVALNNFLPKLFFIQPSVISSIFKSELERLFRIGSDTIFRHVIYGVKYLTAVTVNVLLMKTSTF